VAPDSSLLAVSLQDPVVAAELQEAQRLMDRAEPAKHLEVPENTDAAGRLVFLGRGSVRHHEVPIEAAFPGSKREVEVVHVAKEPCNGDPDCGVKVDTPDDIEAPGEGVGVDASPYGDEVEVAEEEEGAQVRAKHQKTPKVSLADMDEPAPMLD